MTKAFSCAPNGHQECIRDALQRADELCRQRQVRLTPLRRRVLELVWQQHRPVGAYDLLEELRQQGRVAPPTVYRALDFLQQQGLIHRLESLNAFIGCIQPQDSHQGQFLICRSCRTLAEISDPRISSAIERSALDAGFTPLSQTVEVMGLCAACRLREKEQDNG